MEYGQFCPIAKATEIVGEKMDFADYPRTVDGGYSL